MPHAERARSSAPAAAGSRVLLRRAWPLYAAAGALALLAFAAWNFSPLKERTSGKGLEELISLARGLPWAPLWVVGAYAAGALALVPITLLVVVTAALFPNWIGLALVTLGTALNCEVGYGLGRALGRPVVRRYFRESTDALTAQLSGVDTWKLFLIRFFPITPFATMNIVCGTARLAQGPFLVSGVASVLPGAVMLIAFKGFFLSRGGAIGPAIAIGLVLLFGVPYLLRWLFKRRRHSPS